MAPPSLVRVFETKLGENDKFRWITTHLREIFLLYKWDWLYSWSNSLVHRRLVKEALTNSWCQVVWEKNNLITAFVNVFGGKMFFRVGVEAFEILNIDGPSTKVSNPSLKVNQQRWGESYLSICSLQQGRRRCLWIYYSQRAAIIVE